VWGPNSGECSIIEPWNVGPKFFEANRRTLQWRTRLIPYIYTMHRQLFDTGVGILQPLYYHYPALDGAYRMTASDNAQYFFGNDIMVAPITAAAQGDNGDPTQKLATKQVWIPPGASWYNGLTGELHTAGASLEGELHTRGYTLGEVPMWFRSGAVVPYLPLSSLPSLTGVAHKQYDFLGFRVVPSTKGGSGTAYEDDGSTTGYLGNTFVRTTCTVSVAEGRTDVTITSDGADKAYRDFPKQRSYQIRLLNALPPRNVSVSVPGSAAITAVPFVRFGAVKASRSTPPSSQWYYAFDEDEGLAVVVDLVGVPTSAKISLSLAGDVDAATSAALNGGLYGTLIRAVYAHANQDVDRTNPDENSPGPAYLSQLASVGVSLEKLADPQSPAGAFANVVASVPALLANATQELQAIKQPNGRVNYTLALLGSAA